MHAKQIIQLSLRTTTTVVLIVCLAVECLAQPIIPTADQDLARRLASIDDLLEVEDWDRAIDVLESVQISGDENVIPVNDQLLLKASEYARILLTQLPQPALERYRQRFETRAEGLWNQANLTGDVTFLETIAQEAFLTRMAEKAITHLAEMSLQAGEFEAAYAYWLMLVPSEYPQALLIRYPDPEMPLSDVLAKLIVCRILAGELEVAKFELSVYRERYPEAEGTLAGRSGLWRNLLEGLLNSTREQTPMVSSVTSNRTRNSN